MFADMDNQMVEKNQRHHNHEIHSNRYHAIYHDFVKNMILDISSFERVLVLVIKQMTSEVQNGTKGFVQSLN